ncbi:MAG: hypothetical protein DMG81_15190 [Acidobacteria bacterium]|nr:MAG: hypothetical protein DMG81_15190 [Acidobacteriota bacterium]
MGSLRLALLESYHQDETAPLRRPQVYGNSLPLAVVFSPNIDHVQHCSFCQPVRPLALFRILQESLQNAVKHSHAHEFEVDLRGGAGEISLTITDRGVGFDQDEAMHGRGLGLISMRERLQLVNGTLAIESKPGHGTTIRACAPIRGDVSPLSATG